MDGKRGSPHYLWNDWPACGGAAAAPSSRELFGGLVRHVYASGSGSRATASPTGTLMARRRRRRPIWRGAPGATETPARGMAVAAAPDGGVWLGGRFEGALRWAGRANETTLAGAFSPLCPLRRGRRPLAARQLGVGDWRWSWLAATPEVSGATGRGRSFTAVFDGGGCSWAAPRRRAGGSHCLVSPPAGRRVVWTAPCANCP